MAKIKNKQFKAFTKIFGAYKKKLGVYMDMQDNLYHCPRYCGTVISTLLVIMVTSFRLFLQHAIF